MKHRTMRAVFAAATIALAGCAMQQGAPEGASTGHPELSAQEMLTPCASCHQDVTPEIYEEWFQSGHGIGNVKCYMCHGTYEDLKKVPETSKCAVCHDGQFHRTIPGKSCWECHPSHKFSVHKK